MKVINPRTDYYRPHYGNFERPSWSISFQDERERVFVLDLGQREPTLTEVVARLVDWHEEVRACDDAAMMRDPA
jgi:hypothetical protein